MMLHTEQTCGRGDIVVCHGHCLGHEGNPKTGTGRTIG
jgi:hypothetical protein